MNIAVEVAQQLLQIKAIKLSPQKPFTWASGLKSPIYCDNRTILSYPATRKKIIQYFVAQIKELFPNVEVIAAVATAGIPHGMLLADQLDLPFVYVRDKPKAHGRQNLIEGVVHAGQKVVLIEDLISTGGSSLAALQALREAECHVLGTLAIFTYQFPEAQLAFDAVGCPLSTLSNYAELMLAAMAENYIAEADLETLKDWSTDPKAWSLRWVG
jgi:orotate phosphoribosyltransferase